MCGDYLDALLSIFDFALSGAEQAAERPTWSRFRKFIALIGFVSNILDLTSDGFYGKEIDWSNDVLAGLYVASMLLTPYFAIISVF